MSKQNLMARFVKTLVQYTRPQLPVAFSLMILASLSEGIGLMLLLPMLTIMGLGTEEGTNPIAQVTQIAFNTVGIPFTLLPILAIFITLITIRAILVYSREIFLLKMQLEFVDELRSQVHQDIGRANWLFILKLRTSDLLHVLTEDIERIGYAAHLIIQSVVMFGMGLAYLVVSFYLSPQLTLVAIVAGSILLLLLKGFSSKAHQLGEDETESGKVVFASINEFLNGIKLVKSYCAESFYYDYYKESTTALRNKLIAFQQASSVAQQLFQIGSAILLSLFIYIAVEVLQLPISHLLVLAVIFVRLMPILSGLQRNYERISHMLPAYAATIELQHSCQKASEPQQQVSSPPISLKNAINLTSASFSYNKKERLLNRISLKVPAKQTTAFIGRSGAGKSTIADILAGLMLPTEGNIKIDSISLNEQNLASWRSRVAYVPQDVFLFNDSLRANLQWAKPGSKEEELWLALELAAAKTFVSELPNKLDTIVGERGIRLSGGERQRIALARALLRKPDLLILDEATSALDNNNERLIKHSIDSLHGDLTIVLIAHRLSTIEQADQFFLVKDGQVIKTTWQEVQSVH